jgi:tetratricopeptide (TPR) repeat protein
MSSQESKQKFDQASALFKAGRHAEALQLLNALNQAHPNSKEILFPAALCLEQLGQTEQALNLCEQLLTQHGDNRAQQIKDRLAPPTIPGMEGLEGLDALNFDIGGPSKRSTPPRIPVAASNTNTYMMIAGLVAVVVVVLLVSANLKARSMNETAAMLERMQQDPQNFSMDAMGGAIGPSILQGILLVLLVGIPSAYLALMAIGQLLHNDIVEDLKDILLTVVVCYLLFCTCIGTFYVPFHLRKHYDL